MRDHQRNTSRERRLKENKKRKRCSVSGRDVYKNEKRSDKALSVFHHISIGMIKPL